MGSPGHGPWSEGHPQGHRVDLTDPYSTLNHPHNQALAPYTSNVGHDGLVYPTTVSCLFTYLSSRPPLFTVTSLKGPSEHRGDQTHHGSHQMPVVPGPPRLEYHAPVAPVRVTPHFLASTYLSDLPSSRRI